MKLLSSEHAPATIHEWAEEDKRYIDELVKHREWLKGRLEVHAHNTNVREILSDHLRELRELIHNEINDYKANYGETYKLLS